MELRDLRTFCAIVELGGMTRAAQRLHLAQSAISQAVRRLEVEVGLPLLERRSDGVRPTEAGAAVHRHAKRILNDVRGLEDELEAFRGLRKGVVSVGLMPTMTPLVLPAFVRSVDEHASGLDLHVEESTGGRLLEGLRLGRFDLLVLMFPLDAPGLEVVEVGALPLAALVSPSHHLARRSSVPLGELADERWISWPPTNPGRRWLDDYARQVGFQPSVVSEVESLIQLKAFVEAAHGITLLPRGVAAAELASGTLAAVDVVEPEPSVRIGYASGPRWPSAAAARVRELLDDVLQRLVSSAASPPSCRTSSSAAPRAAPRPTSPP